MEPTQNSSSSEFKSYENTLSRQKATNQLLAGFLANIKDTNLRAMAFQGELREKITKTITEEYAQYTNQIAKAKSCRNQLVEQYTSIRIAIDSATLKGALLTKAVEGFQPGYFSSQQGYGIQYRLPQAESRFKLAFPEISHAGKTETGAETDLSLPQIVQTILDKIQELTSLREEILTFQEALHSIDSESPLQAMSYQDHKKRFDAFLNSKTGKDTGLESEMTARLTALENSQLPDFLLEKTMIRNRWAHLLHREGEIKTLLEAQMEKVSPPNVEQESIKSMSLSQEEQTVLALLKNIVSFREEIEVDLLRTDLTGDEKKTLGNRRKTTLESLKNGINTFVQNSYIPSTASKLDSSMDENKRYLTIFSNALAMLDANMQEIDSIFRERRSWSFHPEKLTEEMKKEEYLETIRQQQIKLEESIPGGLIAAVSSFNPFNWFGSSPTTPRNA